VRRALLLFAIVLGMAALAASLSRPPEEQRATPEKREPRPPTAAPAPAGQAPAQVLFDAAEKETRRLAAGRAATLEVAVEEPGSVEIPDLGLSAAAEELTPARFEVLPARPGEYEIRFTPAAGSESQPAGRLVVTSAG
jgi:hypothetical protein